MLLRPQSCRLRVPARRRDANARGPTCPRPACVRACGVLPPSGYASAPLWRVPSARDDRRASAQWGVLQRFSPRAVEYTLLAVKPTICVNMIVKNEARVIERCLASIRPWIDSWVIVDTGSTDGTQELIRRCMADLPGELHERPWRDFGSNRSEAIELAQSRADYLLIIDADEVLRTESGFAMPTLSAEAYQLKTVLGSTVYYRTQLVSTRLTWRFEGIVHEYLECGHPVHHEKLEGLVNYPTADGARSEDPSKFLKDAKLLETALEKDPGHRRYQFYLAQSYRDAGLPLQSQLAYQARAALGGWDEEVWYSRYQAARLGEQLEQPEADVLHAYLTAYQFRPSRAEALCYLARYERLRSQFHLAYLFAKTASELPPPADILFVDAAVYDWTSKDELAIAAYYLGKHAEAIAVNTVLLESSRLPEQQRERIYANREFSLKTLRGSGD